MRSIEIAVRVLLAACNRTRGAGLALPGMQVRGR